MRIGIDCRLWSQTGVGRYMRNLVVELAKLDTRSEYVLFFRQDEFETVPLPGKNFKKVLADVAWHSVAEQFAFKKILEKEKLDLIHFPYFSYPIGYRGKFVITIHDLIIDHFPTGKASMLPSPMYFIKRLGYRFVLRSAVRNAKEIIAVSGATKQEIIDHYHVNSQKVSITYEGIDENIAADSKEKVDLRKPFFFSVGNAYPHKNLERAVDAFEIFLQENPDVQYIFVGKKDYFSSQLEDYVKKKNLHHAILFYRDISDKQLAYMYSKALAVVVPSLMEGFGLPALEAMAHTCLVVASEIPAFLEVCGEVPIYFDPYSAEDLAKKLRSVYKKEIPHILEKKDEGIVRSKKFSWRRTAQETLHVYQRAMS